MARRTGGSPASRPEGSTRAPRRTAGGDTSRRRVTRPQASDRWIVPLLLLVAAVGTLVAGHGQDCLNLADNTPGSPGGQVCTSTMAPGAVVVAVLLAAAGAFVWLVQRRR